MKHQIWKYVSVDALISKIYSDYESTDDAFVAQVAQIIKKTKQ
jgi:hypothetical protein